MTDRELINFAIEAKGFAYCPYSHFPVGAAIECTDGKVYTGCSIENAALGSTICAECAALSKAVSSGSRNIVRIAIAANSEDFCVPCGSCRQRLAEFAPNMEVLCVRGDGRYVSYRLSTLLPAVFSGSFLE